MKLSSPTFLAVAGAMIAIANVTANANHLFDNHPHLAWILYGVAAIFFLSALVVYQREDASKPSPRIVAVRYGSLPKGPRNRDGQWRKPDGTPFSIAEVLAGKHLFGCGLAIVNDDNEPAYMVSVNNAAIGNSEFSLEFEGNPKTRIARDDGEAYAEAWIRKDNTNMGGAALMQVMVDEDIDEFTATITYKDANNRWYETLYKFERNVMNRDRGIDVHLLRTYPVKKTLLQYWEQIKQPLRYALVVSIPFVAGVVTRDLPWWQQTISGVLSVSLVTWSIVRTRTTDKPAKRAQLEAGPQPRQSPPPSEDTNENLNQRALNLCKEVKTSFAQFLASSPMPVWDKTKGDAIDWAIDELSPWKKKSQAWMDGRHRASIEKIRHEFAERGLTDIELDKAINESYPNQETINKIVQKFRLLSSQVEDTSGELSGPNSAAERTEASKPILKRPHLQAGHPGSFGWRDMLGIGITFTNDEYRYESTAHNVRASIQLRHILGDEQRVNPGVWCDRLGKFMDVVPSLAMGESSTVLIALNHTGNPKADYRPVRCIPLVYENAPHLELGEWEVNVKVEGDNVGCEYIYTMTIQANGGFSSVIKQEKHW